MEQRAPKRVELTDEGVLIAAVQLSVDLRGIGHELPGVLHVRVGKQCEVRGLFVFSV